MLILEEVEKKVEELLNSYKRKFNQSIELIVNLKDFDMKKPSNRILDYFPLPNIGEKNKIIIFSDKIKSLPYENVRIINSAELQKITKREAKKIAKNYDIFLSDKEVITLVGKQMGFTLGPRGKMPKILEGDLNKILEEAERYVRIRIKDHPQIQVKVGSEKMEAKKIAENILTIVNYLLNKLEKGRENIKEILIKKTMSKPIVLFKYGK